MKGAADAENARRNSEAASHAEFDLTPHVLRRLVQREITEQEIRQAGAAGVVIEDYPDDKCSPSCLSMGFTYEERPLHIHVSLADTTLVRVITAYETDPSDWIGLTTRRHWCSSVLSVVTNRAGRT